MKVNLKMDFQTVMEFIRPSIFNLLVSSKMDHLLDKEFNDLKKDYLLVKLKETVKLDT